MRSLDGRGSIASQLSPQIVRNHEEHIDGPGRGCARFARQEKGESGRQNRCASSRIARKGKSHDRLEIEALRHECPQRTRRLRAIVPDVNLDRSLGCRRSSVPRNRLCLMLRAKWVPAKPEEGKFLLIDHFKSPRVLPSEQSEDLWGLLLLSNMDLSAWSTSTLRTHLTDRSSLIPLHP